MGRPKPERLDLLLVRLGLAPSRHQAQALIAAGKVTVDGLPSDKPSARVYPDRSIAVKDDGPRWVGRGALKLLDAIARLGVDPSGRTCADLGASTGGFTQVLLAKGATRVYAIDVGTNQLAWSLRTDSRVVVMEGVNARYLDGLPEAVDLVVGDLSFISLTQILPTVHRLLAPGGDAVLLVKPQFEAGRENVGKGGLVRDPAARADAIASVADAAVAEGFDVVGAVDCAVPGARAGNVEHFLHLRPFPSV